MRNKCKTLQTDLKSTRVNGVFEGTVTFYDSRSCSRVMSQCTHLFEIVKAPLKLCLLVSSVQKCH